MFCKKCGNEITESIKYCSKCGNKVSFERKNNWLIIILGLIIFISIIAVIIFTVVKSKNYNGSYNEANGGSYNEGNDENNNESYNEIYDDGYVDFYRTPDWYEDPYNSGAEIKMPNLVGMNCADLRNYLDTNYLYFITDINYKYNTGDNVARYPITF